MMVCVTKLPSWKVLFQPIHFHAVGGRFIIDRIKLGWRPFKMVTIPDSQRPHGHIALLLCINYVSVTIHNWKVGHSNTHLRQTSSRCECCHITAHPVTTASDRLHPCTTSLYSAHFQFHFYLRHPDSVASSVWDSSRMAMENVHILVNTPSMEYFNRCSCFVSLYQRRVDMCGKCANTVFVGTSKCLRTCFGR